MSIWMAVSCTSCDWTVDEIHVKAKQLRCLRDSKKNQTEHQAQQIISRWKSSESAVICSNEENQRQKQSEKQQSFQRLEKPLRFVNKRYLALGNKKLLRQRYGNWWGQLTCNVQNTVSEVHSAAAHQIKWRICFLPALQSVYQALFRWGSISARGQSFWQFLPHHVRHSLVRENRASKCKDCSIISKNTSGPCGEAWVPRTEVVDMCTSQNPLDGMGTVIFLISTRE